jgi:hypothetical protein
MNISYIGRDFGMLSYRKRLGRSLREMSREEMMRTWILSIRQRREKERVLARRVIVMEEHHSQGIRIT